MACIVSVDRIESPYIHCREEKVACVDETGGACDAAGGDAAEADAAGGEGCVGREGTVSDGVEGGNVNSGAERTRSEKKL
jgi:hypothetical protein